MWDIFGTQARRRLENLERVVEALGVDNYESRKRHKRLLEHLGLREIAVPATPQKYELIKVKKSSGS